MQPGVTVVLATVWLVVYADVVGPTSLHPSRLTLDQYSPLAPQQRQHGLYRRIEAGLNWKDQNHDENQLFDLSIGPRRSISIGGIGSQEQSSKSKYLEMDTPLPLSEEKTNDDFSPLVEDKSSNFPDQKFTDGKTNDRGTKGLESSSRELSPPSDLEDPFVADDTFQDQGPGSVEIYKLDLLRVNYLLNPTPAPRFLSDGKSKTPKKTGNTSWKVKTTEYKASSPKMFKKQSNSFDDTSTEVPPNTDPFSIGGVPELQVGCEGSVASDHSKQKRSIDFDGRDKNLREIIPWTGVTPISLDLDYDLSSEEGYEEIDELVRLKKLETTTKGGRPNRGDMEATLYSDFSDDKKAKEKLPVRGDLGKTSAQNDSSVLSTVSGDGDQQGEERTALEVLHSVKGKEEARDEMKPADGLATGANQRRKILWLGNSDVAEPPGNERRIRRGIWGFGEEEGVVSSDELQTENQRRRQYYESRRREEERRGQEAEDRRREEEQRQSSIGNRTNSDIEKIKEEYQKTLEQRQRQEEERQRRLQQDPRREPQNRWQTEDEQRRRAQEEELRRNRWMDEERRRQESEAARGRHESRPQAPANEEQRKRQRQRQQEAETRRSEENRSREEEKRRRLHAEEVARRTAYSRWEEETKRKQQQEQDRRNLEEREREWALKRKQDEDEGRRMQQQNSRNEPSNLVYPARAAPNENRSYSAEAERQMREQEERQRQRKLNEYIQRNRPINVSSQDRQRGDANRGRQEEERRRLEEERKLQEYIRRNQPVRVSKVDESYDRNLQEYRRRIDEARQYNRSRYSVPGSGRRNHGPSAPTNIDPRDYAEEARRREAGRRMEEERIRESQRQQAQLRREVLRREEEARRIQSRRYEEERKRLEDERRLKELRDAEARRNQTGRTRPLDNTRPSYEDRRRFEEHRRRQDTSLIPANLLLNESRRTVELERQRQEQERRRAEAGRRWHEGSRTKETRVDEQRARAMEEQRRRQEEARLNALPVSARIIVRPTTSTALPNVVSRMNFDRDIDFQGANPYRPGIKVPNFPVPPTARPPAQSPPPCVWAVVQCCPSNVNRLVTCFESMGCPGANWDPNPCRGSITQAAKEEVIKFYAETEAKEDENDDYF